jgi:hypothetical protein
LLERALLNTNGFERAPELQRSVRDVFAETVLDLCERRGVAAVLAAAVKCRRVWAQREARVKPKSPLSPANSDEIEDAKAFLDASATHHSAHRGCRDARPDVFGMAKNETIYLARVTINRGGNFLIGTILEEHLHI